jgi:hypothetical protein
VYWVDLEAGNASGKGLKNMFVGGRRRLRFPRRTRHCDDQSPFHI